MMDPVTTRKEEMRDTRIGSQGEMIEAVQEEDVVEVTVPHKNNLASNKRVI